MRIIARSSFALGLAAAIGLMASAAANAQAYGPGYSYGPYEYDAPPYLGDLGGARGPYAAVPRGPYAAVPGGAYGAYRGGTSVPYDAGGPGWNDFQLQGRGSAAAGRPPSAAGRTAI
jgi:hypothetical protein